MRKCKAAKLNKTGNQLDRTRTTEVRKGEISSKTKSMEIIESCILCCKPLNNSERRRGADENYKNLIKCCQKFLQDECTNGLTRWTFREGNALPFCIVCFTSSEKLHQAVKDLEELQNYLEECICTFSNEIKSSKNLYSHKIQLARVGINNTQDENHPSLNSSNINMKDERILLSDECDDNSNDYFQDDNSHSDGTEENPTNPTKINTPKIIENMSSTRTKVISADFVKSKSVANSNVDTRVHIQSQEVKIGDKRTSMHLTGNVFVPSLSSHYVQDAKNGQEIMTTKNGETSNPAMIVQRTQGLALKPVTDQQFNPVVEKRRKLDDVEINDFPDLDLMIENSIDNHMNSNPNQKLRAGNEIAQSNRAEMNEQIGGTHNNILSRTINRVESTPQCSQTFHTMKVSENRKKMYKIFPKNYCKYCDMDCLSFDGYRIHMKKHNIRRSLHHCSICELKWTSMAALFKHMCTVHQNLNPYRCGDCDRLYYTEEAFNAHKYIHEQGYDPVDDSNLFIEWTFQSLEEINERAIKPQVPLVKMLVGYKCDVCDMYFEYTRNLDEHNGEFGHLNEKTAECKYCQRLFYRSRDVTHHLKECDVRTGLLNPNKAAERANEMDETDTTKKPRIKTWGMKRKYYPFQCCVCQETFKLALQLENHSRESGHVNERSFACKQCPKSYFRQKDLKDHKGQVHKYTQFTCEVCGNVFFNSRSFATHLKRHKNSKLENTIRCNICSKTWATIQQLHDHINNDHKDAKPLKCSKCDRQYYSQEKFEQHNKLHIDAISKNLPFEEPDQEKQWTLQNIDQYKKQPLPTSNKSWQNGFICVHCGQLFVLAKLLEAHSKKSGHKNEKTAPCSRCGKLFFRLRDIVSHKFNCGKSTEKKTISKDMQKSTE